MSENKKVIPVKPKKRDFEKEVMTKVTSSQVTMKPKWYFATGSALAVFGLVGLSIMVVFLINVILFLFRNHGPMGQWRLELMLASFPWWIPVLAAAGIVIGIWLLKKYDFSYKKNFLLIIAGFIASLIITAWLINYLGLNEVWSKRSMMRRFYQRLELKDIYIPAGQVKGWKENSLDKKRRVR